MANLEKLLQLCELMDHLERTQGGYTFDKASGLDEPISDNGEGGVRGHLLSHNWTTEMVMNFVGNLSSECNRTKSPHPLGLYNK